LSSPSKNDIEAQNDLHVLEEYKRQLQKWELFKYSAHAALEAFPSAPNWQRPFHWFVKKQPKSG